MAAGDSTIRVNIIGDAKKLTSELQTAETNVNGSFDRLKGAAAGLAAGLAAAFTTDKIVDFVGDALDEADRLSDATDRLITQLGPDLTSALRDTADEMANLGLSRQDVLELEAMFADMATAAGVADDKIADLAPTAAETAGALAKITESDPTDVIEDIIDAATGGEDATRRLGVNMGTVADGAAGVAESGGAAAGAMSDADLAAQGLLDVLDQLNPRLELARDGTKDVADRQAELSARWETVTGQIGEGVEGPLNDFLAWLTSGIDGLGGLTQTLSDTGVDIIRFAAGPVATLIDAFQDVVGILDTTIKRLTTLDRFGGGGSGGGGGSSGGGFGGGGGRSRGGSYEPRTVNVNVRGGNPADVERSVTDAIRGFTRRNDSGFEWPD